MATFLNTGVLGSVAGTTLSIQGLEPEFEALKTRVEAGRRTLGGVTEAEREAQRRRRERRLAQQQVTTRGRSPGVDTADIRPPTIEVTPDAPPEVQAKQQAANEAVQQQNIAKVATEAPQAAPAPKKLAPERQFTGADIEFARAFSAFQQNIASKPSNPINRARRDIQRQLSGVISLAEATGRSELISASKSITGILGQRDISAKNVGQAKASTISAAASIRNVLDLEAAVRAEAPTAGLTAGKTLNKATSPLRKAGGVRGLFSRLFIKR